MEFNPDNLKQMPDIGDKGEVHIVPESILMKEEDLVGEDELNLEMIVDEEEIRS